MNFLQLRKITLATNKIYQLLSSATLRTSLNYPVVIHKRWYPCQKGLANLSPGLKEKFQLWMKWDKNMDTKRELFQLLDADPEELETRLTERLTFGTAGLQGPMQAGFNGMNDLVVIQTSQGLCKYIKDKFPDTRCLENQGVVIGYDGRCNSKHFAELSATVFVLNGVKVWLFSETVIAPFVPYTLLQKNSLAGIMITGSNNPKEYNGYKVYGHNGALVLPPHDRNIQKAICQCLEPDDEAWCPEILDDCLLVADPTCEIRQSYYKELEIEIPGEFKKINEKTQTPVVYTALHGVAYPFIQKGFQTLKLAPVTPVEDQIEPDPEFPTAEDPDPTEGECALMQAMQTAEESGIPLVIANDPDGGRFAVAYYNKERKEWKLFTGDEIGALLGWWVLQNFKALDANLCIEKSAMLSTVVNSKLLRTMAEAEGFQYVETPSGFKWIGNKATELIRNRQQVLLGYDESMGYMVSSTLYDKDGVSAACHFMTMVNYLKAKYNRTIVQQLEVLYDTFGLHISHNSYFTSPDPVVTKRIFNRLRTYEEKPKTYPKGVGKHNIRFVRDLTGGYDSAQPDCKARLPKDPDSETITFTFRRNIELTLRTSDAAEEIKYYSEIAGKPGDKDRIKLEQTLKDVVTVALQEFLNPECNKLEPKEE